MVYYDMRRIFLYQAIVTLSIGLCAQRAAATNWHCYYTNCLYLFVPQVYDGWTVTAARAELSIVRRAERFGALTNVTAGAVVAVRLQAAPGGFAAYHIFGAQQHRLWEPMELGVRVVKTITFADGTQRTLGAREYYWAGRDAAVIRCGRDDHSDRVEDREAAAARALDDCVRRHQAQTNRANDVLFVARWGYAS